MGGDEILVQTKGYSIGFVEGWLVGLSLFFPGFHLANPSMAELLILLLHLADDLAGTSKALDHLLAFLPPADGVFALLEKIVKFGNLVHILEKFTLHFILCVSDIDVSKVFSLTVGKMKNC